jgi:hypothetical protein
VTRVNEMQKVVSGRDVRDDKMYDGSPSREPDSAKPRRSYGIGSYGEAKDAKYMTGKYYCY